MQTHKHPPSIELGPVICSCKQCCRKDLYPGFLGYIFKYFCRTEIARSVGMRVFFFYLDGSCQVLTHLPSLKALPVYTLNSCLVCPLQGCMASLLGSPSPSAAPFADPPGSPPGFGQMPPSCPLPPGCVQGPILRTPSGISKHKADKSGTHNSHFGRTFLFSSKLCCRVWSNPFINFD